MVVVVAALKLNGTSLTMVPPFVWLLSTLVRYVAEKVDGVVTWCKRNHGGARLERVVYALDTADNERRVALKFFEVQARGRL